MKLNLQKGAADITGIVILVVLITFLLVTPKSPSKPSFASTSSWDWSTGTTLTSAGQGSASGGTSGDKATDIYYTSLIAINSGNASYAYQATEEYITIDNRGQAAINITGWQLRNGKDERTYYQGGSLQRFSADVAEIPQGTLLLSPSGNSLMQDVVLNSGDRAIVTTGSIFPGSPYRVSAFKENMCTGYIESLSDHAFSPALSQNCPRPSLEPGVESLDSQCRDFINTLSSCKTPEFTIKTDNGANCSNCVNGKRFSSTCIAFLKDHYSYKGCVAYHAGEPNFSGRTWRVFLGRSWEMWNKDYETIELYDRLGQLVNFQNY